MTAVQQIEQALSVTEKRDIRELSPLALAYLGDTVYDLYVRTLLVSHGAHTPNALHLAAAKRVCAAGQAAAYEKIGDMLSPEELGVFKRGRNAHSGTMPKNASSADYHTATGLETLVGWLWLSGQDERLTELMRRILEGE